MRFKYFYWALLGVLFSGVVSATFAPVPDWQLAQSCRPGSPMLASDMCWGRIYSPAPYDVPVNIGNYPLGLQVPNYLMVGQMPPWMMMNGPGIPNYPGDMYFPNMISMNGMPGAFPGSIPGLGGGVRAF